MWGAILEKAFAKFHGNYVHIDGGWPVYSVRTMHGTPMETIYHNQTDKETLWNRIVAHDNDKDILQAGTPGGSDRYTNEYGLVQGHAYTLLGHAVLSNGTRLVKLRNPWGSEKFHGRWSDDSNLWTDQFKQDAGWRKADDGVFFMQIEDYISQASETFVNQDTTGWGSDHFLLTNDNTNSPGRYSWCGSGCTRHEFTLKNEANVEQDIYITGHTWDDRGKAK